MEMDISLMSHINPFGSYKRHTLMNDMNDDGPAQDLNRQPLAYQVNALLTELLGLAI